MVALIRRVRTTRTPRPPRSLAGQFLALQLVVVALLLVVVGFLGVRQSTTDFTAEAGSRMGSVAEDVANLQTVRRQLNLARTDPAEAASLEGDLAPLVVRGVSVYGADDVYLVGVDGVVLAASDPARVGERADLGASNALEGRTWTGDIEIDGERTLVAHVPVLARNGDLLALAVAELPYPTTRERVTGAASELTLYLGLGTLLGGLGTYVVSRVVKRSTRGLAATDFANLADHRQALLHSIREGVVAVGTDGRVTMMNDAARSTFGVVDDPVGRRVHDLGLDDQVTDLLAGSGDVQDAVALVGTRVVVFNRRAATSRGRGIGSVTTVRDRTELVSMESQLSSNLSITDTLRAQTHEFDNQLHTISGLVQLGEFDELGTMLGSLTRHRAEVGRLVADRIDDPAVAAMVVAKHSVAEERGVALVLDPGTRLPALPRDVSADLLTVVGNLVDNAVDACAAAPEAAVEVWLVLSEARDVVHVRVRDNGPGVPEDLRSAVFVRGFSTKPDVLGGRGIGLPLVQLICSERGGRVEVDRATEEGGAEFRVTLPVGAALGQDGVS